MQLGIIGAGRVSQAFARLLVANGHEVLLSNSGGPQTLGEVTTKLGPKARAVTVSEAASSGMVMLGVPWPKISESLRDLPPWNGRILIDATNPFISDTQLLDLGGQVSSEIVAALVPGARVVKAINNLPAERFDAGPLVGRGRRVAFVSGDDDEAKKQVGTLISSVGFAVIDLGSLSVGGLMQQAGGPLAGIDLVRIG